jgi:uncharacterized membrane protein
MMLGMVVVGVFAGVLLGRNTERFRRTRVDWVAAKGAVKKGRSVAMAEMRKTALTVLIVGAVLVAIFIGMMNLNN